MGHADEKHLKIFCPGWCGSVDWVLVCEPKGRWFDFQSGHMPGFWAWSLVGDVQEATNQHFSHQCFSPSLSPSLPLSPKLNKQNIFLNIKNILNTHTKKHPSWKTHRRHDLFFPAYQLKDHMIYLFRMLQKKNLIFPGRNWAILTAGHGHHPSRLHNLSGKLEIVHT